jgi:hypothetical protein
MNLRGAPPAWQKPCAWRRGRITRHPRVYPDALGRGAGPSLIGLYWLHPLDRKAGIIPSVRIKRQMLGSKQPPAGRARRGVGSGPPIERARGRFGFVVPHKYEPTRPNCLLGHLVSLRRNDGSEPNLVAQVRGFQTEPDRVRGLAARRWVKAVNRRADLGTWGLAVCREPHGSGNLSQELNSASLAGRATGEGTSDSANR